MSGVAGEAAVEGAEARLREDTSPFEEPGGP